MIYLTGDTHIPIDIKKLNTKEFPEQKNLTRNDYVIVLGDFGLLWKKDRTYEYWKKWLEEKTFTVLWLDGNHCNFDWIDSLPVTTWHNGKVHQISENIIHLMRGQVFEIENNSIFVCGGATSYDKEMRVPHISWWPQEDISYKEADEALKNLENIGNKVDYVLSHTCPESIAREMYTEITPDPTVRFLEEVKNIVSFKKWYFGHHHIDKDFGEKFTCLYNTIRKLGE